jgi:hypothetical protein
MNLRQMVGAYVEAKSNEDAAFRAIGAECTDAQCHAYFDACDGVRIARDRMLIEARKIALTMVKDEDNRNNVTAFFDKAIERNGNTREKAIKRAFELAVLTEQQA